MRIGRGGLNGTGRQVIELTGFPAKPTEVQADELMRLLTAELGRGRWGAVKLSGYWVISNVPDGVDEMWRPVFGHEPGQQTRAFDKAVANATGLAVVRTVPLR